MPVHTPTPPINQPPAPLPSLGQGGRRTLAQLAAAANGLPTPLEMRTHAAGAQSILSHSVTSHGAADFAFPTYAGQPGYGWRQQKAALERARADGAPLAADGWVAAMHRTIVWKLASVERCFGRHLEAEASVARGASSSTSSPDASSPSLDLFSVEAVHRALVRRYEHEMVKGSRPTLRRLSEDARASRLLS